MSREKLCQTSVDFCCARPITLGNNMSFQICTTNIEANRGISYILAKYGDICDIHKTIKPAKDIDGYKGHAFT